MSSLDTARTVRALMDAQAALQPAAVYALAVPADAADGVGAQLSPTVARLVKQFAQPAA